MATVGGGGDGRRAVSRKHASLRERLDYLEAGLATQLGLRDAIRRLGVRGLEGDRESQRQQIEIRIRTLETAIDEIQDDLFGYLTAASKMRPLGSASCEMIRARTHQLLGLPRGALPFEVLDITRQLLAAWDCTRAEGIERAGADARDPATPDAAGRAPREEPEPSVNGGRT